MSLCDPLVPVTVKLSGLSMDVVRSSRVSVVLCPTNIGLESKSHVTLEEHDRVMLPVKLEGPEADMV